MTPAMQRRLVGIGIGLALVLLVLLIMWASLLMRAALFDFVYGDAARELIREMVKPEALK